MLVSTLEDLRTWRRQLHAHPELSLQEFETTAYIRQEISKMGLAYQAPMETATVVYLQGQLTDTLLLRADIDALPIQEETGFDFQSQKPGVMHACGHDGHTSILLATLKDLKALADQGQLYHSVLAVFQPAEETFGGGNLLIQAFDFKAYPIKAAYALHLNPDYPVGTLVTRQGPLMASCTEFTIEVKGQAAHVGVRERGLNALHAVHLVYQQVQTIPTFKLDAKHTNIIHIGTLKAGEAVNSVPAFARMTGTIRTYDQADFALIQDQLDKICQGIALATDCQIDLTFAVGYPAVINDAVLLESVQKAAGNAGADFYLQPEPYLLGEDFSFFQAVAPINYSFVGIRDENKGYTAGLHTSRLAFDEEALIYGVDYFVQLVQDRG
ncbi:TPA: M20 family metallopeptidase [Streptococcus suis]